MRVLVTGGTGYLGSELVRRGAEGVSTRDFDVRDEDAVRDALADRRPDVVIHTAYRQDPPDAQSVNIDGAAIVARAAADAAARLIHMSTDVVFSGRAGWYTEDEPPDPVTDYGRTKAEAERAVAAAAPDALIVRTSILYGGPVPGRHERDALEARFPFFTDELRCPTRVDDLADALLELAELEVSGILHVAAEQAVSRCELARAIAGRDVPCTTTAAAGVVRPLDCTLDSSKARALLRTRLRPLREVLA
jgi:dTDP-4-dehydrorhamnose reductase